MTYEHLLAALAEFDLPLRASLQEIRERYRQLVRQYHPDSAVSDDPERICRINAAYAVLNDYLSQYPFDFSKQAFFERYPEERVREQFYGKDLWKSR